MRGRGRVSEADHFLSGDAVSSVEVHQPVEGAERLFPDAVLTAPFQHSEMLHPVTVAAKLRGVRTEKGMKAGMHAPFCSNTSANARAASFFIPPARFFVREFVQTLPLPLPLHVWESPKSSQEVTDLTSKTHTHVNKHINLV